MVKGWEFGEPKWVWFCFRFSGVYRKMLAMAALIWRLDWGWRIPFQDDSLTWMLWGGLSCSPSRPFHCTWLSHSHLPWRAREDQPCLLEPSLSSRMLLFPFFTIFQKQVTGYSPEWRGGSLGFLWRESWRICGPVGFFLVETFLKNWSIVDLQCCINFCCIVKWFSYTYIYMHTFSYSFPLWLIIGYWI